MWQVALASSGGTVALMTTGYLLFGRRNVVKPADERMRYSKAIVLLSLSVMTIMMVADIALCWRACQQLDPASVVAMSGFWGTEVFVSAWIKVTETKNPAASQPAKKPPTETTPSGEPYEP